MIRTRNRFWLAALALAVALIVAALAACTPPNLPAPIPPTESTSAPATTEGAKQTYDYGFSELPPRPAEAYGQTGCWGPVQTGPDNYVWTVDAPTHNPGFDWLLTPEPKTTNEYLSWFVTPEVAGMVQGGAQAELADGTCQNEPYEHVAKDLDGHPAVQLRLPLYSGERYTQAVMYLVDDPGPTASDIPTPGPPLHTV